jgi:hypothetical protein
MWRQPGWTAVSAIKTIRQIRILTAYVPPVILEIPGRYPHLTTQQMRLTAFLAI